VAAAVTQVKEGIEVSAPPSLLLVDDEPGVLTALRRTLRREGYTIATAASGEEALTVLARQEVDLVIADLDMPGMSGLELLGRVRVTSPLTIRVVLTGRGSLESAQQAINEGEVFRYLTKPWTDAELRGAIRGALARRAATVEAGEGARAMGELQARLLDLEPRYPGISRPPAQGGYVVDLDRIDRLVELLGDGELARWVDEA
jgi:CheY-like chemotaxis protein